MTISDHTMSRLVRRLIRYLTTGLLLGLPGWGLAHPMPNSVVLLTIQPNGVRVELQLPLSELELAFGHNVARNPEKLVSRLGPELRSYIRQHVRPISPNGRAWTVAVGDLVVQSAVPDSGQTIGVSPYQELTAYLSLTPPAGDSPRRFTLQYDVIIHQLITHVALVSIHQDWDAGINADRPVEVGVIRLDIPSNTIPPLQIDQVDGGMWLGFRSMIELGTQHIAEGTDHLLFLLALLLPAPLLPGKKRWGLFGGVGYSLNRLLWIITAFTLGHSLTLLAGATGWFRPPEQPVEILIAFSVLVSAIHALRPLFPGRETYIAAGFGLIHGLAFASTLANLALDPARMVLSILGFNLGIELMQLVVIILTIPWLILLSRTPIYKFVRTAGALFAGTAAVAWMIERTVGQTNPLAAFAEQIARYAP